MEQTTVERLIQECYKIAKLGNMDHNLEIISFSDGTFRASMYYDYADNVCLATALTQLKANLIVKAKPVIEKNLKDNQANIEYHHKCADAYNLKIRDAEEALQSL